MLQIICWLESEDYSYFNSLNEKNTPVNYYAYRINITGGPEATSNSKIVSIIVVELINANIAVGIAIPETLEIDGEFKLGFISQEFPDKNIPLTCKLSKEVKRAEYMGDENEKLEYVGFSLEKFYQNKGVNFYLNDLRGIGKTNR